MAKRKTGAAKRRAGTGRARASARKRARGARKAGGSRRKTAARRGARTTRKTAGRKKATARRPRRTARKATARKATTRRRPARKAGARKRPAGAARGGTIPRRRTPRSSGPPRTAPSLNRPRRIVEEEDLVPTPPSSLDLNRHASAARTGRQEMRERRENLTQTSAAMTGGDVDADWESAYSVGDEAPGGDNPTPDQDIVDDIGRAVGVEYEDNEELKGEEKIARRDRNRWELDPASAEDYNDRD